MDSGAAVVVGALIALAGSSLIPWLRDSLRARADRADARANRIRDAVTDLIAATGAQAAALTLANDKDLHKAFEARTRATARLLLETPADEREALSRMLNLASPTANNGGPVLLALQITLTAWVAGSLRAADLKSEYKAKLASFTSG